jgi:hypothetical protein
MNKQLIAIGKDNQPAPSNCCHDKGGFCVAAGGPTTWYHECSLCHKPCDMYAPRTKSPMQELREIAGKEPENKDTCEFGSGWAYSLGLFLAHAWKLGDDLRHYREWYKKRDAEAAALNMYTDQDAMEMWAQGAGDHLIEFKPELGPPHLVERGEALKRGVLALRFAHLDGHPQITVDDAFGFIREAKNLLRELDIHNGVPTLLAEWD